MKFILPNINLDIYYTDEDAVYFIYNKFLKNTNAKVSIYKKSVDARKKDDIHFCFSAASYLGLPSKRYAISVSLVK